MGTNGNRRPLEHVEWVRKAASSDQARPVLCGYHVSEQSMAATDGYRLHIGPKLASAQLGVWTLRRRADRRHLPQLGPGRTGRPGQPTRWPLTFHA